MHLISGRLVDVFYLLISIDMYEIFGIIEIVYLNLSLRKCSMAKYLPVPFILSHYEKL